MRGHEHTRALAVATVLAVAARPSFGQAPGGGQNADSVAQFVGRVHDPDGRGIANAEVTVTPKPVGTTVTLARRMYSDDSGTFRFPALPKGPASVTVRRIGYKPAALESRIPGDSSLTVRLESAALTLSAVVVQDRRRRYEGPLAEFNRRRDLGFGRFITRGQIDDRHPIRTSDMLRWVPGVNVQHTIHGSSLRIRGNQCDPLVWVDGTPALAGYLDVDIFTPNTLDGVEIYSGVSEVPVELRGPRGEERCGVVALWSRMPERRPRQSKKKPLTAEEINKLVESATIYTADQVDRPVQADSAMLVEPYFPDSLKSKGASGGAVVEFVVDTEGHVETETISIVSSSHPAFGRAAREAVFSARFIPAMRQGRAVRQLVQLPFEFQATDRKR